MKPHEHVTSTACEELVKQPRNQTTVLDTRIVYKTVKLALVSHIIFNKYDSASILLYTTGTSKSIYVQEVHSQTQHQQ